MSTFIINLNDTVAMSDSAVVELAKVINTCQPSVQEVQTSNNDVKIAVIVCASVILVTFIIAVLSYFCCKRKDKEQTGQITKLTKENGDLKEENENLKGQLTKASEVKSAKSNEEKAKVLLKDIVSMSKDKEGVTNVDTADRLLKLYNDILTEIKKHNDN